MIEELPKVINEEQNSELQQVLVKEEVKEAVMGLNRSSTGGPDDMARAIFQDIWEIIGENIYRIVQAFYCGVELPIFVTHKILVLLPKKATVNIFSNLRPISLSNFVNKIFL